MKKKKLLDCCWPILRYSEREVAKGSEIIRVATCEGHKLNQSQINKIPGIDIAGGKYIPVDDVRAILQRKLERKNRKGISHA